jgi:D-glycero-D-manno-heptose 1,7-bisphosphate phosphatase
MLTKVVFLDRDGVINQDSPDYIKNWLEFHFIPGGLQALKRLKTSGFTTIVITNQSGVHRNLFSQTNLDEIHTNMQHAVAAHGGWIEDIYFCPHHPEENCDCRKPKPGMILQAQQQHRIDLSTAYMVGDSVKDMECAWNAACGFTVLVRTGNGKNAEKTLSETKASPDHAAENLLDAVGWIINHHRRISMPQP